MNSKICATVTALLLSAGIACADDLNHFHFRGLAYKVTLDKQWVGGNLEIVESQVHLHEISQGFEHGAWFTCPTGSCTNPSNLLGCTAVLASSTNTPNGVFETWTCPDGVDGHCLGVTGYINFEGHPFMRPFMEALGIVPEECTARQ